MTSMALTIGRRGSRQARSLRLGAAAGIGAAMLSLVVVALLSSRGSSKPAHDLAARQSAVSDWEATVHPMISSGGEVVALGPRTAVADLAQRKVPDARMQQMATGWVRRLSELREQIAAVPTPTELRPAHALLDSAMAGYVSASRDLFDAASAIGQRRTALLEAAAAAGRTADHEYDQAMATIARLRAQLDLPTDWSDS
ncbi:MAG: hypothetical protein QOJ79_699 [Actinomycetota bacterium]|jgi:hypothetical protein|nr:hypothetical protein [Actinomycetota bacterium]